MTGLSDAARVVWAKYDRESNGWLPLRRHMADSAAVAGLLWDEWLPDQVHQRIATALPGGLDDARRLAVWLAAVHDIGKATPAFACQVDSLADPMRDAGLGMPTSKRMPDRGFAPHGLAGMALLTEWLVERSGWRAREVHQFGIVVGGHHGVPPKYPDITALAVRSDLIRTPGSASQWAAAQTELLDACAEACQVVDRLPTWRGVKLPQTAQVLLSGLVIVADWIASNSDLFPYFPDAEHRGETERVAAAWDGLALPPPWRAAEPAEDPAELFAARFSLPAGARLRPIQERAVRLARAMSEPGLMIIEAPMGEGKTEAALAVAEVFAARSGAGGCFVALPTMATSNAMFSRVREWLDRLPDTRVESGTRSVFLAHSKAALNEEYGDLLRAGQRLASGIDIDGGDDQWRHRDDVQVASTELVAHQWLRGRKKGMLSSFVVGTIDQLLFMGLKSRHLALRHLALAGKVVVIDEAHAFDTYMNSYLDRALSWLGAYRVPVVVLSATLPSARRRDLASAYAGGSDTALTSVAESDGYPLLTVAGPGTPADAHIVEPSGRRIEVRVERLDDDLESLADRLAGELAGGGCALVVRNTVDRVLEAAAFLRNRFDAKNVTVAHSRFLDLDRAAKDKHLLNRFGPPGAGGSRPSGTHIVVASQVAEQSLDIDFDLLVSDLCPIDLLLQRMGRLHRHQRERPERLREARCLVTGAEWTTVPVDPVQGSRRIYRTHALLRAAAVLEPYLGGTAEPGEVVRLPEDISGLVQRAYGSDPVGPAEWHEAMDQAFRAELTHRANQQCRAEAFQLNGVGRDGQAVIGWVEAGVGDADDTRHGRAQVRDSEESLEVLVIRRRPDGTLTTVPWLTDDLGGLELPTNAPPSPRAARAVAACGLRLPYQFTFPQVIGRVIDELEASYVPAWQSKECHWLAGELILVLDENVGDDGVTYRARLAGFDLRYTDHDGLEVTRVQ